MGNTASILTLFDNDKWIMPLGEAFDDPRISEAYTKLDEKYGPLAEQIRAIALKKVRKLIAE